VRRSYPLAILSVDGAALGVSALVLAASAGGFDKGAVLYGRVLGNLKQACENPLHENWSSFMSHNVRTSYFDDLKEKIFRRHSDKLCDPPSYRDRRAQWQVDSMFFKDRKRAFLEAPEVVTNCFSASISDKARLILGSQNYVPEFMYYSTMGRADLVQFAAWNSKHYERGDRLPSIRDLRSNEIGMPTEPLAG
jgi:hypothetical protein